MTNPITLAVMDQNACRNCRRPIELLRNVGWVHAELPQYAHEEPTCDRPVPVDPRCPRCDDLVAASSVGSGNSVKLALHVPRGCQLPCAGSGAVVARPA